jgi:succinate dehydrogenase hydrophobic membrane anchor protein
MTVPEESRGIDAFLLPILEKLPVLSYYARNRGWHYIIGWLQRFTGVWLVIAMAVHIYTLSLLQTPDAYDANMKILAWPIFVFLAWASSLVVGFHALNGGRLILYELFGKRNDAAMVRWTFGLSLSYAAMIGLITIMNIRSAPAAFYWLMTFFAGIVTAYAVASRLWKSRHSVLWMLQRISGTFLFIAVPAYLLFLCLNPSVADEAQAAVARMQNVFVRNTTLVVAASALYHAGYGLFSIVADYVPSRTARAGMTALIVAAVAVLGLLTFRLLFTLQ